MPAGVRIHAAGDTQAQAFARGLDGVWDAATIFAPVGALVPLALQAVRKGGRVVCGIIHMSDIPTFSYRLLWEERQLLSVANLTRAAAEFRRATKSRVGAGGERDTLFP